MFILTSCLTVFLLFLAVEKFLLNRWLKRIRLRITVTGTRGKTSVTRMLASVLKEDGRRVLAKTTGSEAVLVLPDGTRRQLKRRGIPSIREQIGLVRKAFHLRADCLVSEIMSLQPENHFFESQRILQPGLVVVTNVRLDHTDVMGNTEEAIASVFALDIPPEATVFVPQRYNRPVFAEAAGSGGTLVEVRTSAEQTTTESHENVDLVYAVARYLKIDDRTTLSGIAKATYDIGKLKVWKACSQDGARSFYMASAFAANDPESTFQVLATILERLPAASDKVIGLLNLRSDRGARTLQWIEALRQGGNCLFRRLYVTGSHSIAFRRRVPAAKVLTGRSPELMTATVSSDAPDGSLIFGFGNIKGPGLDLVNHWSKVGEDYGI